MFVKSVNSKSKGAVISKTTIDSDDITVALNKALGSTSVVVVIFVILALIFGNLSPTSNFVKPVENENPRQLAITWDEPIFLPRHEECIDPSNGQDLPEFGIGYEPSLSMDSEGNLFVTAHKDLRWGGEGNPFAPFIGGNLDTYYACEDGEMTTWDYWASWFWISNDGGETWSHGDNFDPTPGNLVNSAIGSATGAGSECLGDEGDIAVDGNDLVYYLDTYLEDNWWHIFSDGGNSYEMGAVCQRTNTMAGDDRPWVAAQGDGVIHYLGNSGASPPECSGDSGRYWYYHSENGGNTFSQCYSMPGGWSTIAAEPNGPYVYVAQENADTDTGTVQIRISDDYGRGTGPGPSDGTWQEPIEIGPRKGNPPEGYPVVNTNNNGTVAVVWADCPNGDIGAWEMNFAISYDHGTNWSSWNITPFEEGISMYPFVSISENNVVSVSFYGMDYNDDELDGNYVEGEEWFLYSGALYHPEENDTWEFTISDISDWDGDGIIDPLHTVTAYEEENSDVHALHDFFETVISPDGSWIGIAYQQNIGLHPFEENEEQRYIKFVSGNIDTAIIENNAES